ncbi:MAG: metallophosphoesterase, partial [Candidatus Thorarchaeota archaeon]
MQRNKFGILLLIILVSPIPALFMGIPTSEITLMDGNVLSNGVTPFDRGPTVNMVTNNSAVIFWRTTDLTNATVRYGLDISVSLSVSNSTLDTDHLVSLTGLDINTKYYYQAVSNGTVSPVYHFFTAPADGDEFKMIIIGDNRPSTTVEQPAEFAQLASMIVAESPHIVIMTGDYVMEVTDNHAENLLMWEHFTNISDSIGHYAPIYGVIGNHDTGAKTGTLKLEYFFDAFVQYGEPSLYFSFDYAGVHMVFLTSEEQGYESRIVGDQLAWLENDLESTDRAMKFVTVHRPLYPIAHIDDSYKDIPAADREAIQAVYEEHNVSLLITGHDHCFNRLTVNGIVQVIAGGGGAPVYNHPTWGGGFFHYVRTNVSSNHIN